LLSFVRLHRIPKRFAQPLNRDPVGHLVLTCGLAQEVGGAPADEGLIWPIFPGIWTHSTLIAVQKI
jgi:hypothetical protein